MKLSKFKLTAISLVALSPAALAQHFHLNAGALGQSPGSQLYFVNGATFVAESGFVVNMVLRTNGPAAGLYDGGVTFAAAASDPINGGPEPGHAALGAQLALVAESLSGPAGSSWAFWESDQCEDFGDRITFSLPAGVTNGTNLFLLSQNNGQPNEDPYGHCHGRRFTAAKPGLHTVGFQIRDLSRNGPGSGPLHTPSEIFYLHFQAGVTISRLERDGAGVTATFGTRSGSRYHLEANSLLDGSQPWVTVAGPANGNNRLQTLTNTSSMDESRQFYRLRVETP